MMDDNISEEILKLAVKLFSNWSAKAWVNSDMLVGSQEIKNWRNRPSVALLTTYEDLWTLAKDLKCTKEYKILFLWDNVLRIDIGDAPN